MKDYEPVKKGGQIIHLSTAAEVKLFLITLIAMAGMWLAFLPACDENYRECSKTSYAEPPPRQSTGE